jgi:hypothetical protein
VIYQADDIVLNTETRQVWCGDREVHVTGLEFDLLRYMVAEPFRVRSYAELRRDVWGYKVDSESRTFATFAARLRMKLGNPDLFATRRGYGCSLLPAPSTAGREIVMAEGPYTTRAQMRQQLPANPAWPMHDFRITISVPRQMPYDERERWVRACASAAGRQRWLINPRERMKDAAITVHDGDGVSVQIDTIALHKAA